LIVALVSSTSAQEAEASLTGAWETGVLVVIAQQWRRQWLRNNFGGSAAMVAQQWRRSNGGAAMGRSDGREGGGAMMA
jgi:hypothetical protein